MDCLTFPFKVPFVFLSNFSYFFDGKSRVPQGCFEASSFISKRNEMISRISEQEFSCETAEMAAGK